MNEQQMEGTCAGCGRTTQDVVANKWCHGAHWDCYVCPECSDDTLEYVEWTELVTPETPRFRSICAWCKRDLGTAPEGCTADTHGICTPCKDMFLTPEEA